MSRQPIAISDEQESGQEYFEYENDPYKELKLKNARFSDNYYQDRLYVQQNYKDFLIGV